MCATADGVSSIPVAIFPSADILENFLEDAHAHTKCKGLQPSFCTLGAGERRAFNLQKALLQCLDVLSMALPVDHRDMLLSRGRMSGKHIDT